MKTRSPALNGRLEEIPPTHLYHYTTPQGLIGILKSKEIWATNTAYLNDFNELVETSKAAKNILENKINRVEGNEPEKSFLSQMHEKAGKAAKRYYVCSFTEDRDSISQWRAYCPSSGGYAIGIPSKQLKNLAAENGWYFVKCVYDNKLKYQIVTEIINSFLEEYKQGIKSNNSPEGFEGKLVWQFSQYLAKIGGAIKNNSFEGEREWRIISPNISEENSRIEFREGASSVVPYYKFPLQTEKNPNLVNNGEDNVRLVVGPTPHMPEAQQAAQFILTRYLGGGGFSRSSIPFRGW